MGFPKNTTQIVQLIENYPLESYSELAKKANISIQTFIRRVEELRSTGIIGKIHSSLNPESLRLERHLVIFKTSTIKEIKSLELACDKHPYTSSRNRIFGTDYGLLFYNGLKWIIYNTSNSGIPSNEVRSIVCEDLTIWVGFANDAGLAQFDGERWKVYDSTNSPLGEILNLPDSGPLELVITDLAIDSKHNIWIGTNAEGIYKFNKSNWTRFYPSFQTPISSPAINAIDIDKEDIVWIGHAEPTGVDCFDGKNWTNFTPENSPLPYWWISDIHIDNNNVKWFATPFGLAGFNNMNWVVYDSSNMIVDEGLIIIRSITSDKNILWVGTDFGLLSNKNSEWNVYYINDLEPPIYENITSVKVDRNDNKWLGTYNGLYKFNENGLNKHYNK